MKKALLFIAMILLQVNILVAQTSQYTREIDSLYTNIDKSQITTGLLYDRVIPMASLHTFNSLYPDTSYGAHFTQAWYELFSSAYNNSNLFTPNNLNNKINEYLNNNILPIGLLNYSFNTIDTLAIEKNLFYTQDYFLYDVPGRTQSPYVQKNVLITSVLADTISFKQSYIIKLPTDLLFTNNTEGIQNIQADFNNGQGLQTINVGEEKIINYYSPGEKNIKFIITMQGGQQKITYSRVYLKSPDILAMRSMFGDMEKKHSFRIEADIPFQGYEENREFYGRADITIYYHTNKSDSKINKPILVIDGFDPESKRKEDEIYDLLIGENVNTPLPKSLREKGYDIILVDFPNYTIDGVNIDGGSDYIQRNAFTLIKLINNINDSLKNYGSSEKLVVLGPSMGGLISRYALAYMEKHNMNHNTRLWVSFDSPHLGANISIGAQWMLEYLGVKLGIGAVKDKLDKKLNTYAAKQMLLHHYLSGSETPTPHWSRNLFMNELNELGFPQNLRKIAVANGVANGNTFASFGETSLRFEYQPTIAMRIATGITSIFTGKLFLKILTGGLSTSSNFLKTECYFTPGYNGRGVVFDGDVFNGLLVNRTRYATSPVNSIGLDNCPGGLYDTQKEIKDAIFEKLDKGLLRVIAKPVVKKIVESHSFIPFKSSLAITSGTNFGEDFSNRNLLTAKETPFDTYFAANSNEGHIYLTNCNVSWIGNEIEGINQEPVGIKPVIIGENTSCGIQNRSIINYPKGQTIQWSSTVQDGVFLSPKGADNSSVDISGSYSGYLTLKASYTNMCGEVNITTTQVLLNTNKPSSYSIGIRKISTGNSPFDMHAYMITYNGRELPIVRWWWDELLRATVIQSLEPNEYFEFEGLGGTVRSMHPFTPSNKGYGFVFEGYNAPSGVKVRYKNNCGFSDWTNFFFNNYYSYYSVSPNPSSSVINISPDNSNLNMRSNTINKSETSTTVFDQITISNISGNIKLRQNTRKTNTLQLNVSSLPNGIYYLNLYNGGKLIEKKTIQISK